MARTNIRNVASDNVASDNVASENVALDPNGLPTVDADLSGAYKTLGTIKMVPFDSIVFKREDNPRDQTRYTPESLEPLAREIYSAGYLTKPMVVVVQKDGTKVARQGNRRGAAIDMIRTIGIPASKLGEKVPPIPGYMPEVPAILKTGLTLAQELALIHDHADRTKMGLSKTEVYRAAKLLKTACVFTHDQIADQIGMSRSNYTNSIAKVLVLPQCVEDAFLREDGPTLNQTTIKRMKDAYDMDIKAGASTYREAGPSFKAEWEKFASSGSEQPVRMLNKSDLEALAENAFDTDISRLLQAIINGNKPSANDVIARIRFRLKPHGEFVAVSEGVETGTGITPTVD